MAAFCKACGQWAGGIGFSGAETTEDVANEVVDIGLLAPGAPIGIEASPPFFLADDSVKANDVGKAIFIFPAMEVVGIGSCPPSLLATGMPKGAMPGFRPAPGVADWSGAAPTLFAVEGTDTAGVGFRPVETVDVGSCVPALFVTGSVCPVGDFFNPGTAGPDIKGGAPTLFCN